MIIKRAIARPVPNPPGWLEQQTNDFQDENWDLAKRAQSFAELRAELDLIEADRKKPV